jgi:hypothetical protein
VCVYPIAREDRALKKLRTRRLAAAALLSGPRATALARLLDTRRSGDGSSCDAGLAVLVQLRYRSGRAVTATAAGCDPERLAIATGGTFAIHSTVTANALSGLFDLPLGGLRIQTPDFIGRQLASAIHAIAHAPGVAVDPGVSLAAVIDPATRFEQIIWQDPLPDTRQDAASFSFGFVVAVPRARPCRAGQLVGHFQEGGSGTGLSFGSIEILNRSDAPCGLRGSLTLTGLNRTGQRATHTITEPISSQLVLSPDTSIRTLVQHRGASLSATFIFAGNARDDPRPPHGLCYAHETTPTDWLIRLRTGGEFRFKNGGRHDMPFSSCRGDLISAPNAPPGLGGVQLHGR